MELKELREKLNSTRVRCGISVGATVFLGAAVKAEQLTSGQGLLLGSICLAQATHDVLQSINLGQEIAARQAVADTAQASRANS